MMTQDFKRAKHWLRLSTEIEVPNTTIITTPRDMKVRDVIREIERDGWYLVATRGSHRQYKHLTKAGRVTIAGKQGDDVPPGTLNNILTQAGLRKGR